MTVIVYFDDSCSRKLCEKMLKPITLNKIISKLCLVLNQ